MSFSFLESMKSEIPCVFYISARIGDNNGAHPSLATHCVAANYFGVWIDEYRCLADDFPPSRTSSSSPSSSLSLPSLSSSYGNKQPTFTPYKQWPQQQRRRRRRQQTCTEATFIQSNLQSYRRQSICSCEKYLCKDCHLSTYTGLEF